MKMTIEQKRHKFNGCSRWPCRCLRCFARVTKKRHPDEYVRDHCRLCSFCGGALSVDYYRMEPKNREKDRGITCYHDCLPYRHMISNKKCKQNLDYVLDRSLSKSTNVKPDQNKEADF